MSSQSDSKNKIITCPECGAHLREVYAEASYGRILLLDQCESCGGIWFDNWELYFLKDAEARRLDKVNVDTLLTKNPARSGDSVCPRCSGVRLEAFQDANLPQDSLIERCSHCNGLWLNRGELIKYEEHKNRLRNKFDVPRASKKEVQNVLDVEGQLAKWETVSHLSAALRTRPEHGVNTLDIGDTKWDRAELSKDAIFLILQLLFKVIFKI